MVEQTNKNERLQSELDRAKKETSDSFAKANVIVTQERGLTACRGEVDKNPSPEPEKGKIVEGNLSGDKKQILPPKKTKYRPKAFNDNGSGDKGITPDKNKGSQETAVQSMVKVSKDFWNVRSTRSDEVGPKETTGLSPQHHKIYDGFIYLIITVDLLVHVFASNRGIADSTIRLYFALLIATACFNIGICIYHAGNVVENANTSYKTMEKNFDTKDCAISGTGLIAEESTSGALASNCDIFAPKSTHDLTTQTLCRCMWHKWLAFCVYNTSLVNFYAAYLTLNGCKKHVTALINTFFGWTGARMSTYVFETNECIANSFTAKFTAMKHTIIHVLSSASHLLAPCTMPVKVQRRRLFERSSSIIMLAVVFTVSIIAGSQAQQVSLQFCVLLLPSSSL
jgi:hypothetical protein